MPETVRQLAEEVATLKDGTLQLASQVQALSGALSTIHAVQREQGERMAATASHEDVAERVSEAQTEVRGEVRTTRLLAQVVALLVVFIIVLAAVWLRSYVSFRRYSYDRCLERNAQSEKIGELINNALSAPSTVKLTPEQEAFRQRQIDLFRAAFPASPSCENLRFHWWP